MTFSRDEVVKRAIERAVTDETASLWLEVNRHIGAVPEDQRQSLDLLLHAVEQAFRKRRVARGVGV